MMEGWWTLSKKSAGAGHRAVSLHRDWVLVFNYLTPPFFPLTDTRKFSFSMAAGNYCIRNLVTSSLKPTQNKAVEYMHVNY